MKYNDFSWDDIILEAPGDDDLGGDEELTATDYAAADDMTVEEGEPLDEDPLGDENADGQDDTTTSEEQTNDNITTDKQNINLINDYVELYQRIDIIMTQLRTDCISHLKYNPNLLVAKQNLNNLKDITYDYLTNKFSKESYVSNLYQFNLIIQALNVNIELLGSIIKHNKDKVKK